MSIRPFALFVVALVAAACASTPPVVGGGEIRNETPSVIHQVKAVHEPTKRTVFANQILPGHALALGFSPREMQATHADLTWRTADGKACSARIDAPPCPAELVDKVTWVIYSIHADGTATVRLTAARN